MHHRYPYYHTGSFVIHVDFCADGVLSGRFHFPSDGENGNFSSLMELILKMEQKLDENNSPQAFHSIRTFCPPQFLWEDRDSVQKPHSGKVATFAVNILFRRNASWQGNLTWLEEGENRHFRSVLELILLMNSALDSKQKQLPIFKEKNPPLEWAE